MIVIMFEKPMILMSISWIFEVVLGNKNVVSILDSSKSPKIWNIEWTILKEEKNPTIWFFHFIVKLQPFLEQNSNHPCFFIPLIQEVEFFFIEIFEHIQLLNMSDEKDLANGIYQCC